MEDRIQRLEWYSKHKTPGLQYWKNQGLESLLERL